MKFWPLPAYSKLTVLQDKHEKYVKQAICDPDTHIIKDTDCYVIYDTEEALEIRVKNPLLLLAVELFYIIKSFRSSSP